MAVTIFHMSMNLILLLMMNINIYIFYFIREILEKRIDVPEQNMCLQLSQATWKYYIYLLWWVFILFNLIKSIFNYAINT